MKIWTEEAKAAQREAIQKWKPWSKSTGPRTAEGKCRCALNPRKQGQISIKARNILRTALRAQKDALKTATLYLHVLKLKNIEKQTIILTELVRLFQGYSDLFIDGLRDWNRHQKGEGGVMLPIPERILV